jgi:hypothetical protein
LLQSNPNFATMKKLLFFSFLLVLTLLLISNYRIPFFKQHGGPWSIGYGTSVHFPDSIPVKDNAIFPVEKLQKIQGDTEFLADPFFVKEKDTFYLFFEHKTNKPNAVIGVLTSADGKNYTYAGTVLEEEFHLSYPQVFKYRNEFYMVPESKAAGSVMLYKSYRFPFDWRVCDTLLANVKYKDPTIHLSDTLNIMVVSDDNLNMFMYEADSLFGKWKLHKRPKVLTGSEARAGGRIFANKNGLLLPVQNGRNGYGFGLSLHQLTFKNGDYTVKRAKPFFLKRRTDIAAFNAGMHQFDIQRIGGTYYYVYDGNRLASAQKKWNVAGSLKMNYFDLKNWFAQQLY